MQSSWFLMYIICITYYKDEIFPSKKSENLEHFRFLSIRQKFKLNA